MNTTDLLEQMLRGGAQATRSSTGSGAGGLGGLLGGLLGAAGGGAGRGTTGGLGGLLGGLLGGNAGGALRGGAGKYGALASLGMMAFQAYRTWQSQQPSAPQQAVSTIDTLQGPEAEAHSHAILRALIGAAKADGRIDENERKLISAEIERHSDDPQLQAWLNAEVAKPLSAQEVAGAADDAGMAAEMYLASVLVVDDQGPAERDYLDQLAAALQLAPQLQVQLEQQAKTQMA